MKIAIVELSESHEECIFSQVAFLADAGHEVTLIIHPKIDVENYKHLVKQTVHYNFKDVSIFQAWSLQIKLVNYLKTFDKVIFNTASSSKSLRNVVLLMNVYQTECIGVIHHVKKLNKSFTQKVISTKIKKYFTLSDALKNNIRLTNKRLKLESFYPIFFPSTEKTNPVKGEDDVWICIPGSVLFDRRDYHFLLEHLTKIEIPNNLKFVILGNCNTQNGLELKEHLKKHQLLDSFIIFEKFIPNAVFYSYLEHADFIMPLIRQQDKNYIDSKISGAFNLAFGFKKPLLFHEFYNTLPDLKTNGISYNTTNFNSVLSAMANKTVEIPPLYTDKKWSFAYQQHRYINFINS